MKRSSKGFTLVEILVVIAIMAVMMSIIFGSISSARVKSRDNKRISDVKEIQLALSQYYDANNAYPVSTSNTFTALNALAPYISTLPTDPSTGASYYYVTDTSTYFCVAATLEGQLPSSITDNSNTSPNCNTASTTYALTNSS